MSHPWTKTAPPRASPPGYQAAFSGGSEPLLVDVLRDPIIHRLMARDGIEMTAMLALIRMTQGRIQ
ncbi:hypothetical protein A6A04_10435 [Paramagnetospirillum marisnigri]|uniref:Uncharacterized protein n=1 Tax=Paramagnetospirillum marisnigri TaxID=1285242 RepID=A0A178N066_9PROT|nr:hypothetical protein [Paramagnetospirillum marisnigri]OAN55970.1 hypothetical protein A6A04_10435 [Paramagnetospirillum marisnigri]